MDRFLAILKENQQVLLILFVALVARLLCLPFAENVDADSTSRTYMALHWLENPHLITDGVWAPFHTYLNALFMWIIPDSILAVKIQMILLAAATVVPLYALTKELFNGKGAVFASLIYAFSPVVFRNSYHNLSGIVFAFFVITAAYFLYRALKNNKLKWALIAGISMTIAAGVRYEAWMLMAVFFLMSLLYRNWRISILFAAISGIFPVIWMTGNYMEHGDLFYSVSWANYYNIELEGINDDVSRVDYFTRVMFFPWSLMLSITPFILAGFIYGMVISIRKKLWNRDRLIWFVPFVVIFLTYIYKAYTGGLLLHHRYSISLVLFLSPFIGFLFLEERWLRKKRIILGVLVALMVPMSFVHSTLPWYKAFGFSDTLEEATKRACYGFEQTEGIPFMLNPNSGKLANEIVAGHHGTGLIVDFPGWAEQSRIAQEFLHDGYLPIHFVNGNLHGEVNFGMIRNFIQTHPSGTIVLVDESALENRIRYYGNIAMINVESEEVYLELEKITRGGDIKAFHYQLISPSPRDLPENAEPVNKKIVDVEYFRSKIYRDRAWLESIIRGTGWTNSLDDKVTENAQWMLDHMDDESSGKDE